MPRAGPSQNKAETINNQASHNPQIPNNLKTANGGAKINDSYSGFGGQLTYVTEIMGDGGPSDTLNLTQLSLNTTAATIALPEDSSVKALNLTLESLELYEEFHTVVNDSIVYSPNYTISYTLTSNSSAGESNDLNLTANDFAGARLDDINLFINGTFNQTFTGNGFHEEKLKFADPDEYRLVLEFNFDNGTWFTNESFTMFSAPQDNITSFISSSPSYLLNPFLRLNNDDLFPQLAMNFTLSEATTLTSVEFFGKYNLNLLTLNQITISIRDIIAGNPGSTTYGSVQYPTSVFDLYYVPAPTWLEFSFEDGVDLDAGEYYCVIDTTITSNAGNNFLDIYTTNTARDAGQSPKEATDALTWALTQNNFLYKYHTEGFRATDLTEINVNASLTNTTLNTNTLAFNPSTNSTNFTVADGGSWPTLGSYLTITFTANLSCRLQYSYWLINTEEQSSANLNFTADFKGELVLWQTWINATVPTVEAGGIIFDNSTFNYTVYFPEEWHHFNGTAPVTNFTESAITPQLGINSSVAKLNWTFRALSDFAPMELSTVDSRTEFSRNMSINATGSFDSITYNATLSFWNATFGPGEDIGQNVNFSEYMLFTETINHTHFGVFPNFTVPHNYNNTQISAKINWHNQTAAGILLFNFTIKQYAWLDNHTDSYYVVASESNLSLSYRYYNAFGQNIIDAVVSVNWLEGNWSVANIGGQYQIELYAYDTAGWTQGTQHLISVNFTHGTYVQQNHTVNIFIGVSTTLTLTAGQNDIYANGTLDLWFQWYTAENKPIAYKYNDPDLKFDIRLDGAVINSLYGSTQWTFDYEAESPTSNLHVLVQTRYFTETAYLGLHNVNLRVWKANETTRYETQTYNFYFDVTPIPTYLTLESNSATFDEAEFVNHIDPMNISMRFQCHATEEGGLGRVKNFNWATVYGYIFDLSHNERAGEIISLTSLLNGSYLAFFPTADLQSFNDYELRVFSETVNMINQSWSQVFNIIPKWEIFIEFEDPASVMEGDTLKIQGSVFYFNKAEKWPATGEFLTITVEFLNKDGVATHSETFEVKIDVEGYFLDDHITVPDGFSYSNINITYAFGSAPSNEALIVNSLIQIEVDVFNRFLVPIFIILGCLLVGIPLAGRFIIPFAKKKLPEAQWYQKWKGIFPDNEVTQAPDDALLSIKTLRIPQISVEEANSGKILPEFIKIEKVAVKPDLLDKKETIVPKTLGEKITSSLIKTIQDFQDIFVHETDPVQMMVNKNNTFREGVILEQQGKNYPALLHYNIAQKMAKKLKLVEEDDLIEASINRVMGRISPKEQVKFLKDHRI